MEPSVVPFLKQCRALFLSDQLLEMEMNVVISKAIKNPLKKVFLLMLGCTLSRLFIYVFESVRTSEYRQESNAYQTKLAWWVCLISLAGQVDQMAIPVVQRGGVRWIRAGWGPTPPWKYRTSKALVAEPRQLLSRGPERVMDKQGLKLRCCGFLQNMPFCNSYRENPACGRNCEFGRNSELQPAEVIIIYIILYNAL